MNQTIRYTLKVLALTGLYLILAQYGVLFSLKQGNISPIWPPSGLAFAALLLFGKNMWPAITLATFLVTFLTHVPPLTALGVGIGNTLEALLGYYLFTRLKYNIDLKRLNDILGIIFIALVTPVIAATIGVYCFYYSHLLKHSELATAWGTWWWGDVLGIIVLTPFILIWSRHPTLPSKKNGFEGVLAFTSLLLFTIYSFLTLTDLRYLILVFLIWIAFRFQTRGVTLATFIITTTSVWMLFHGKILLNSDYHRNLILLQVYIVSISSTALILAGVIAERKRAEYQLRQSNENLEKIVRKRTKNLLEVNKKLKYQVVERKKAEEKKNEFIGIVSHELKSPITTIKTYAQLLEKQLNKKQDPHANYAQQINTYSDKITRLINDLLDISRVEEGKLPLTKVPFNLSKLLVSTVKNFTLIDKKHKYTATSHYDGDIIADKGRIEQILTNLLTNASKYSPEHTTISVTAKKERKNVIVSIHDEGIGMAPSEIKRIFERYYRISGTEEKKTMSVGLGLYITKVIIERHKGEIWVQSRKGRGSTFFFSLPIK
jgi:signal transduction histidine kinase